MNLTPSAVAAALLTATVLLVVVVFASVRPRHLAEPPKAAPRAEVLGESSTRRAPRQRSERARAEEPAAKPAPTAEPAPTSEPTTSPTIADPPPSTEPTSPTTADPPPSTEPTSPTAPDPPPTDEPTSPTAADPEEPAAPVKTRSGTGGAEVGEPEPAADPAPRGIAARTPQAAVTRYYAALDDRRFAAAWRTLSPTVRSRFGSYTGWRDGYAATVSSRPSAFRVSAAPGGATVKHILAAVDRASCGPVRRRFAVTWHLVQADGVWLAQSLSAVKRSGPEAAPACT